jgi:hypothetical protein
MSKPTRNEALARKIAPVLHEALRQWARVNGELPAPPWQRAPKWMKESTAESALFVLENPGASSGAQHKQWMQQKKRDGWKYGPVKSAERKTHPMMVPFSRLPDFEKKKDALINALVGALS